MTGDDADPEAADVEALASVCGCAGKTPLDRVVYPARDRLRALLADAPVTLADAEDAAVVPLTTELTRAVERRSLDARGDGDEDGDGDGGAGDAQRAGAVGDAASHGDRTWTLAATLGGDDITDPGRFAERLEPAYAALADRGPVTVGKGHSVQVVAATTSRQWFEHLRPAGGDRPGYRTANVDVIHALPALSPARQARVALSNALDDCYAVGGTDERVVRPLLAVPADDAPPPSDVREWYAAAAPEGVAVRPAAVVEHDGRGWLFGATATAAAPGRRPPRESNSARERGCFAAPVEADDAVVLHRPLGGLALYVLAAASDDPTTRDRALAALTDDHRDVASALGAFRPAAGEAFDPDRHLKLATDVSGPGVEGVARRVGRAGGDCRLHLTALPLLDEAALARVRDRWLVPDVTVETNGPLAVVARPAVADEIVDRLSALPGATPCRLGRLRRADAAPGAGPLTVNDDVPAGRYVESLLRRPEVDA